MKIFINDKGAEKFVNDYFIELEKQALEKKSETQYKWYLQQDAKQRFDDYPIIKRERNLATIIAIASLIATIVIAIVK